MQFLAMLLVVLFTTARGDQDQGGSVKPGQMTRLTAQGLAPLLFCPHGNLFLSFTWQRTSSTYFAVAVFTTDLID
jgi:hypothetical protein